MCPLELRCVDPVQSTEWERILEEHREATVFHTAHWARVINRTYGYTPLYFVSTESQRKVAIPLMEVDSWLTGKRGVCLPFTDECRIIGENAEMIEDGFAFIKRVGGERRWRSLEVRGALSGWERHASLSFYSHDLDLRPGPDALFGSFDSSVRRAIRKAEKSGVSVTIRTDGEAMTQYYDLHCLTRRKHGLPPQPSKFFQNIFREMIEKGLGFIALGRVSARPVAGAVFLKYEKKALFKFGASNSADDTLRPTNLVMWRAIEELCGSGNETLNFGRTSIAQEGLRRYKLGWRPVERLVHYLKWDYKRGGFATQRDHSPGLLDRIIQKLPIFAGRAIGRCLYPHVG